MKILSLLLICSFFVIKKNPPDTPPQRFITIQYNGVATYPPHQTFIVINEIKYETKYFWLKNYDMPPQVIKSFSKEILEKIWRGKFNTVIVNETCFNAIEKFVQENTKYFINPDALGHYSHFFTIKGKEYRVDYDRNRWLFADLSYYLKTLHCDSSAYKEMNLYLDSVE